MDLAFKPILYLHAIAGGLALLTGSLNMIRKKGDATHAKIGLIYFYCVLLNACSAFFLSIYHPNLFLFCLAVLSFYLVFTGRRFLMKSKNALAPEDAILDWFLNLVLALFGLILIAYCIYNGLTKGFNFIPMVFGLLSLFLSTRILLRMKSKQSLSPSELMRGHIGSMIGSYITIFSAFLVVNNHDYFPIMIGWFGPSIIFVPWIWRWNKQYAPDKE